MSCSALEAHFKVCDPDEAVFHPEEFSVLAVCILFYRGKINLNFSCDAMVAFSSPLFLGVVNNGQAGGVF